MANTKPITEEAGRASRVPRGAPAEFSSGDLELMRAINNALVLDEIRRQGRVSRVEIAKALGLGRSTVSAITAELRESGLILDAAAAQAPAGGRGRPRIGLELNPRAAHVVGVKIALHQVSGSILDFACNVKGATVVPVRSNRQPPAVVAEIVEDAIRQALDQCGLSMAAVDGICVGIPGFIDSAAGTCHWSPVFSTAPVPFAALLNRRLDVPVFVENDANLVALAERWFGHGRDLDSFVVVTIEHGVGMGLVMNGELHRGARGFASEFGHTQVVPDGAVCRCGQRGCVEAYMADYALLRAAGSDAAAADDPIAQEQAVVAITERARGGDAALQALFREAGQMLGRGLAGLIRLLDPARVILCGEGLRAADLWLPALREAVEAHTRLPAGRPVDIVLHAWGDEGWARGAAARVLQHLYRMPVALRARPAGVAA